MNPILFATNRNRIATGDKLEFGTEFHGSCSYGTFDPNSTKPDFEEISETEFSDAIKNSFEQGKDVVNYLHGFNADFEGSLKQIKEIASCYANDKRQFVLFSWPSEGKNWKKAYQSDKRDAEKSGPDIAKSLNKQMELSADTIGKVHVICQSLGNYAFQFAVKDIAKSQCSLGQVVLSAPVIPRDAFESGQNLEALPKICDRVSLYFNPNDAGKIAAFFFDEPNKMSFKGPSKPLELASNVAVINCDDVLGLEHKYLYKNFDVSSDVNAILDGVASDDKSLNRKYDKSKNEYRLD